jgi:hypothetical protein
MRFPGVAALMYVAASTHAVAQGLPKYEIMPYERVTLNSNPLTTRYSAYKIDRNSNAVYQCTVSFANVTRPPTVRCAKTAFSIASSNFNFATYTFQSKISPPTGELWAVNATSGLVRFCLPAAGAMSNCVDVPDAN